MTEVNTMQAIKAINVTGDLLLTLAIGYYGVRQIYTMQNAQISLDRAEISVQRAMRGAGELILAEGARAQTDALTTHLRAADDALVVLAGKLPDDASRTGPAKEPITHNRGIVKVPQGPGPGPGLGIEINREVLAKYSGHQYQFPGYYSKVILSNILTTQDHRKPVWLLRSRSMTN